MLPRRRLISLSPRFLLTWQCRRFSTVSALRSDAAVQTIPHSTLSQNVSTQMGSRSASSFSVDVFVQTPERSNVLHDVATQLPLTEFFIGCIYSNDPLDRQNFVRQSPPSVQGPRASRRQDSNSQPRLLILLLTLTCLLHMVRPLSAFTVMPCSRLSVPPMWEHTLYAQLLAPKEVLVPPLREPTILLVLILVQEQVLFLNHGHWFFPWSNLGNPSLTGLVTLTQSTAISCIINSAFPFFSGIQARRAEILPTLSPLPVESFMRLFFKKPVIMFRTSPISSWRTPATRTSLSCSTRIPLSLTL